VSPLDTLPFPEVWAVDFEFVARPGERPDPVCLVAQELRSGQLIRLWRDQFGPTPPYSIGPDSLFVAYYSSAELGCHIALGWPMPIRVLDLFVEFRNCLNGLSPPAGWGLVGALTAFGLDSIGTIEKAEMRNLILRGGPWSADERAAILDYCEADVRALAGLLPVMLNKEKIDLPRALLRGRYMPAAAVIEWNGVPVDVRSLNLLRRHWSGIQDLLIARIDRDYHVYDGRTFKYAWFEVFLIKYGIPWPRLDSGHLDLSQEAFRQMSRVYPIISPLRELRHSLSDLRLSDLEVGNDGRNRRILSVFQSRTGRNQPSNSKFIFGPSVWLRSLIQPPPGHAISYIDWSQQEFGIAAALSGDQAMQAAYRSGDPYLGFAKQAGAVPADATKQTHGDVRDLFKATVLGVQYGMGDFGLAAKIGQPPCVARDLLQAHHETYRKFWHWSDAIVDHAMLYGFTQTVFGWRLHIGQKPNPRSLRNFPMQANGAEMLRIACFLAAERGVEVCAPIHDAVLICAPIERVQADVALTQAAMAEASRIVLGGFELESEAKIVPYPERYTDKRGGRMWKEVMGLVESIETAAASVV
jgi:DNA polymerase I